MKQTTQFSARSCGIRDLPLSLAITNDNDNVCINVFVRQIPAIPFSIIGIKPSLYRVVGSPFRLTAENYYATCAKFKLGTDAYRVYRHGPYVSFYFELMCHRPSLTVYVFTVTPVAVE